MWCTWLFPLILLLGSAIIGFLIGWLLRNQKIKELNETNQKFTHQLSDHKKTISTLESDASILANKNTEWEGKFLSEQKSALSWKSSTQNKETQIEKLNLSITDWEGKYNTLNAKVTELTASIEAKSKTITSLEEQLKQLNLKAAADAEKALEKYNQLSKELDQVKLDKQKQEEAYKKQLADWEGKYKALDTKVTELTNSIEAKSKTITSLEEQLKQLNLKADADAEKALEKYNQLSKELDQVKLDKQALSDNLASSVKEYEAQIALLNKQSKELEEANLKQQADYKEQLRVLNNTLTTESDNLAKANKEIERLLALLKQQEQEEQEVENSSAPLSKEEATLQRIKAKAKDLDFERIGLATYATRDDLKVIKGIGPFIEKKLHALGIYTFLQISNLNPEDEEKVNNAIEFFSGRIKRDQWSKQGGELHQEKLDKEEDEDKK